MSSGLASLLLPLVFITVLTTVVTYGTLTIVKKAPFMMTVVPVWFGLGLSGTLMQENPGNDLEGNLVCYLHQYYIQT